MTKWSAQRWSEVSPYLDKALELEGAERQNWLTELEISSPDVARSVRALLAQHDINTSGRFLERSALTPAEEPLPGEQVGAYTLEHLLGRGGMGTVWLARRSDGRFEGKVAIKILSRCGLGPEAAAQIRHEASLLARLSHPNIARLFDAGIRDDGRPFLILEYIEGERIDRYCRSRQCSLATRLRLFLPVLDAVAHAHTQHIVHRDLKPSNILVTPDTIPKLLDFGVASLQPATHSDMQSAGIGQEPKGMTLGYASPEQIRDEAATPASDVYALGILLYVLITDRHPHGADNSTPTQLVNATLTSDCQPASESIGPTTLRRWVRGDLDSIIAKATNRDVAARYANAGEFAEDISCFLEGRPVRARKPTLGYRAGLYVRRLTGWHSGSPDAQRRARTGALLIGALLLSLTGATLWIVSSNNPDPRSIAVLPFIDLSESKDQEYFSDGLSEELIDRLAHTTNLQVIARTSSFQFKGRHEDVRSIAGRLAVAHLLEGSVRKSGDILRISVQLIRAKDGSQMWSQAYDRKLGDVFKVQADIADAVAHALNVALRTDSSGDHLPTPNVEAYNLVLQGNFLKARATRVDVERAMSLYNQAIALDPNYALAWALRPMPPAPCAICWSTTSATAARRSAAVNSKSPCCRRSYRWLPLTWK